VLLGNRAGGSLEAERRRERYAAAVAEAFDRHVRVPPDEQDTICTSAPWEGGSRNGPQGR
jgi:hypothetical protein